ncbi:hypothetical protein F7725_003136 [Dissostichus mawsoni]|uniref:Uncharacterized protein n=1 Tax=Dissostichus mawsoni TaxID=36200 RepID=A0A7J5YCK6_DISMA|nr:hypothetical protein F7725_003136 [Dissostichus mawsoni]
MGGPNMTKKVRGRVCLQKETGMKRHPEKLSISLMITLLCLGSLLTTAFWIIVDNSHLVPNGPPSPKKIPLGPLTFAKDAVRERHSKTWKKQEDNYRNLSSQLSSQCQGFDRAIITQANTPVGSNIVYAAENKKTLKVTPGIFSTFIKENPFPKKKWDTCAVVGNSGILTNSSCGEMIDSAQFVIRCNLPSLGKGYEKHVGTKTDLVWRTNGATRPFVESLQSYGKSMMVLSPFSYAHTTPVCLRAVYSIRDFESPIQPMFFNPDYFRSLALFWRSRGLRRGLLSTGLVMVNIALEHCANVHLYGFWPFSNHPFELNAVNNHYYDDKKATWTVHFMPDEFDLLLRLHSQEMKGDHEKLSISLMITLLCLGSLLTTALWIIVDNSHIVPSGPPSPKKIPPWPSDLCKGCWDQILCTLRKTRDPQAIHHTLNYKQLVASSMDITPDNTTAAKSFPGLFPTAMQPCSAHTGEAAGQPAPLLRGMVLSLLVSECDSPIHPRENTPL